MNKENENEELIESQHDSLNDTINRKLDNLYKK